MLKMNNEMMGDYNRRLEEIKDKFNFFQIDILQKVADAKEASLKVLLTGGNSEGIGATKDVVQDNAYKIAYNMREEQVKQSSLQS